MSKKLKIFTIFIIFILINIFGYVLSVKYQNYKIEQTERDDQILEQKNALKNAVLEIEKLKNNKISNNKNQAESNIAKESILATELNPYLSSVVRVECPPYSGSGTIKKLNGNYYVLTNFHVIEDSYEKGLKNCVFVQFSKSKNEQYFTGSISLINMYAWDKLTDIALLPITDVQSFNDLSKDVSPALLNSKISDLPKCPSDMPIGQDILVMGFPASGSVNLGYITSPSLIVSNGIISGYDNSSSAPTGKLPFSNYFVSAKIDSGNSGGIAISKNKNSLCILGIPTWLNIGNYDTQGVIQNIHNIIYK